jgi:uncharacterized repeat protein (TIGR01451 family)
MTITWPGARTRSGDESGGILPTLRSRGLRMAATLGALALTVSALGATSMLAAPAAYAAPGDPFDTDVASVFVAQGTPTALYQAITGGAGATTFTPVGTATGVQYNAISFNEADGYLYGISGTPAANGFPASSLVRIGQEGTVTRVGTNTFTGTVVGAFGPADGYFYTYAGGLQVIDVTTGALVRTTPGTGDAISGADFAYIGGYFWSASGATISRTDPATGVTQRFPNTFATAEVAADVAGAAWTYGNGNLGLSYNTSGNVYQVAIANPAGTPTFTLVSSNPGPASGQNDGASIRGLPTDLSIVKTGPAALPPAGGTVTYTLSVTNNGPGDSSGYVVNDTVPAPLTNVASPDEACSVTGNDVQCVGGALANGETATYTVTATVPAGVTEVVENTATVTSNELDTIPENNTSTTTGAPTSIALVKNAGTPVDVNGNGLTDAGDTIQYTFDVTNTGQVPLTGISVSDPKIGAVTCPEPTLAVGAAETCEAAAAYTITAEDVTNGSVDNTATATGTTPDGDPITSEPSSTSTPTTAPAPALTVVKSVDPSDQESLVVGQELTYSFVVTNTGNVPLNDVTVVEGTFTGSGELSAIDCPATTLAVGAQFTCTATYTLTQADVDSGTVSNSATAEGTPPGSDTPVPSTPSNVDVPTAQNPAITIVKTSDVETVDAAGDVVTYSFLITNTGNVTLSDVAVDEGAFNGSGDISAAECPTTTLAPGEFVTCTATYTVTQADIDAGGELTNTATADATTPGDDPIESTPSTETITVEQTPALTVMKTANVQAAAVGQVVTYSFLVTNTGNVTITDPTVTEGEFSGTGELSAITCPEDDTIAPGDAITCTATYTVTQADIDAGSLTNTATTTGTTPGGGTTPPSPPSTTEVVTEPLPALSVVKTADLERVTTVGQVVTYSFLATNVGNVTINNVTINEGAFNGHGTLSAITCPDAAAILLPGVSVTCTATYTVVAADLTDGGNLTNTATVTGTTPGGGTITSTPSTATVDEVPPAAPAKDPLASTGANVLPLGLGAAALLLLGAVLVIRRRKIQDSNA